MERATIYIGASGGDVAWLKNALRALQYQVSDGEYYDAKTRSAVEAFQNDYGLKVDGIAAAATWRALELACGKIGAGGNDKAGDGKTAGEGGDAGRITEIQKRLNALGCDAGAPDGKYGPKTESAVKRFQRNNGLAADGIVGEKTWSALFGESAAGGCDGERDKVIEIQKRLNAAGYNPGAADGKYGAKTEDAVRRFQRDNGLKADGIVGEKTWDALSGGNSGNPEDGGAKKYEDEGELVEAVQKRLKELGYYAGEIDGKYGGETESAARRYQTDNGLAPDGVVGARTWASLFGGSEAGAADGSPAAPGELKRGCEGGRVSALQNRLHLLGYYDGAIDGVFGAATERAVTRFQRDFGINPDGMCGERTWTAIMGADPVKPARPGRTRAELDDYPSLWYGDYGNYVRELQDRLRSINYFSGHSTGVFDGETLSAVKAFQRELGAAEDGVVKKPLWKALNVGG